MTNNNNNNNPVGHPRDNDNNNNMGGHDEGVNANVPHNFGFGSNSGVSVSPSLAAAAPGTATDRSREQMNEAIGMIPWERKSAYLEALRKCPSVVERESNVFLFLKCCDYDVWAAAERLCLYWKERLALFGPERAFRPLIMLDEDGKYGALGRNDIFSLRGGFPALLPATRTGQPIIYCDRSQYIPMAAWDNRIRTVFYIFKVLCEQDEATKQGILVLVLLRTPRWHELDAQFLRRVLYIAEHALPLRIHWHFLNYKPSLADRRRYAVQDLIFSMLNHFWESGISISRVQVHFDRGGGEVLHELQEMGLTRSSIPSLFGGEWTFQKFSQWCRDQAERERIEYKLYVEAFQNANGLTAASAVASSEQEVVFLDKNERRRQRQRESNLIASRRKRERRQRELADTKEELDQLLGEQEALQEENRRLQNLWHRAQQIAARLQEQEK